MPHYTSPCSVLVWLNSKLRQSEPLTSLLTQQVVCDQAVSFFEQKIQILSPHFLSCVLKKIKDDSWHLKRYVVIHVISEILNFASSGSLSALHYDCTEKNIFISSFSADNYLWIIWFWGFYLVSQCKYPHGEMQSCIFVLTNIPCFFYKITSAIRA